MKPFSILMLPMPLGVHSYPQMNSELYQSAIQHNKIWVAENARTLRRFLSSLKLGIKIDELSIFELGRRPDIKELHKFLKSGIQNGNINVVSEAGMPGLADPGSEVAKWAHNNGIAVKTLSGPSSVYMALCGSGFNGQQFTFHGYCPVKEEDLTKFIGDLVYARNRTGYTQIFIETPYRNERLIAILIKHLPPGTKLCIAQDIHGESETITTKTVGEWANNLPQTGKTPCIFLIGE